MVEPTLNNFWSFVKAGSVAEKKITVMKRGDGTTVFDKEQVKQVFYEEFKARWAASDKLVEPSPSRKSYPGKYGEELDQEVTPSELDAVIKELKEGKAIGLDGISPSIVKSMTGPTRQYILTFINRCIRERRMPAELKNGRVKLLYKGEDKRVAKNYRN